MKITRVNETDYSVLTDTVMADGSYRADYCCRLTGNRLRSHEQRGDIRTGGLITVNLGPKSLAAVLSLKPGESAIFHAGQPAQAA